MRLYLYIWDTLSNKKFFKYFETEFEMDKFKRKLHFSTLKFKTVAVKFIKS